MARMLVLLALLQSSRAFRVYNDNATYSMFIPYEQGFVSRLEDPKNFKRERVNEGSPSHPDTPFKFGLMSVRVVHLDQSVPMKNMISCMRMPHVAHMPSQACGHVRRASAKWLMGHAKCNAIGSWGMGRRTSCPNGTRAESQPLRKGHAHHALPSGETTGFRDAF